MCGEMCQSCCVFQVSVSRFRASSVLTEWRNGMVANFSIFDLMSVVVNTAKNKQLMLGKSRD